jgi:hypothetical protein
VKGFDCFLLKNNQKTSITTRNMTMLEINEKDVQSLQQYASLGMDDQA